MNLHTNRCFYTFSRLVFSVGRVQTVRLSLLSFLSDEDIGHIYDFVDDLMTSEDSCSSAETPTEKTRFNGAANSCFHY